METPDGRAFLDRPAARWLAALVIVLCGALIGFVHRDDLRSLTSGGELPSTAGGADPAAPCIARRFAEIDAMVEEGLAGPEQVSMFKQRAEAMCRATSGEGAGPPMPPE